MIRNKCKKGTLPSSHSHCLKMFVIHTFLFLDTKIFFFDTPQVGSCRGNSMRRLFCSEQLAPQDSVQTFNAYPYSKHLIYLFIYYIYIYIEQDFLRVMAVLSHTRTHILSRRQNIGHETTALLVTFLFVFFFLFLKNARHLSRSYLYSVTGRVKYHVIYKLI